MAVTPVTPVPGTNSAITSAGVAVVAVGSLPNGGFITNPMAPVDQGLVTAEVLYVDPAGGCATLTANGTIFALQPGDTWTIIPGQTTPTYVNAASAGHKFSVTSW